MQEFAVRLHTVVVTAALALALAGLPLGWVTAAESFRWPDPARLEANIRAFERADSVSPPPHGALVAVGSSSIRLWHDRMGADLAPQIIVPRGFGGSTMRDVLYYVERIVIPYRPTAVLLYEGDNDINDGIPAEEVRATFDTLAARIFAAKSTTRIYVISIKPSPARWSRWPEMARANGLLRKACAAEPRLTFIDVATPMLNARTGRPRRELFGTDSLHLSQAGYDLWARVVRDTLKQVRVRNSMLFFQLLDEYQQGGAMPFRFPFDSPIDVPFDAPRRPLLIPPLGRDSTRARLQPVRRHREQTPFPSVHKRRRMPPRA